MVEKIFPKAGIEPGTARSVAEHNPLSYRVSSCHYYMYIQNTRDRQEKTKLCKSYIIYHLITALNASLKVNGYIFKGSNSAIFILVSLLYRGQLLNERICSPMSKFFLLLSYEQILSLNPIELRMAKTQKSFGRSECSRVKS